MQGGGAMSGYNERDAAKDTDESLKRTAATWHAARDDAAVRGNSDGDRPTEKNRADAERKMAEIIERGRRRERAEGDGRERSR
jgi:hypothetical protein